MKVIVFMVFLVVTTDIAYGRILNGYCELERELDRQGFNIWQLDDWVCLIYAESSKATDAIGAKNRGDSFDFGLFQISSKFWCKYHTPKHSKNLCNIDCRDLLNDDITDASRCAQLIFKERGFAAWTGWVNECQEDKNLDYPTSECFPEAFKRTIEFNREDNSQSSCSIS